MSIIHNAFVSKGDMLHLWKDAHRGTIPVFFLSYNVRDDVRYHLTLIFRPATVHTALALYDFAQKVMLQYKVLSVTIAEKSKIRSAKYANIRDVKVRLDLRIREILTNISMRTFKAHMTDHDNVLKSGMDLLLYPMTEVLYVPLHEPVDVNQAKSFDVFDYGS